MFNKCLEIFIFLQAVSITFQKCSPNVQNPKLLPAVAVCLPPKPVKKFHHSAPRMSTLGLQIVHELVTTHGLGVRVCKNM